MVRQTSVAFVDDLDGSKAVETVKFGLDGKTYEIDLNKRNAAALRKAVAAYVAKYATKGTGARDTPDRPIRSQLDIDHLRVSDHHRRMIQTAWDLGDLHFYDELSLRKWAHMLAFRGHFLTKSKHYSTTFKRIREDRRAFRAAETLERLGLAADEVIVVNPGEGHVGRTERAATLRAKDATPLPFTEVRAG